MQNMSALSHYQSVDIEGRLASSNPHNQISLLFDGILKRLAIATGATKRGDISVKGNSITKAIDILDSLRAMLDHDQGGDIADNLEALYSYMIRRLVEANAKSDITIMGEISSLVNEIKNGWDSIPAEQRS